MSTAIEKKYMGEIASLGCVICGSPAEIHHIRQGQGMSQRASNFLVIPLCPHHHRLGGHGESIHQGQGMFEMRYDDELRLLAKTIERIFKRSL